MPTHRQRESLAIWGNLSYTVQKIVERIQKSGEIIFNRLKGLTIWGYFCWLTTCTHKGGVGFQKVLHERPLCISEGIAREPPLRSSISSILSNITVAATALTATACALSITFDTIRYGTIQHGMISQKLSFISDPILSIVSIETCALSFRLLLLHSPLDKSESSGYLKTSIWSLPLITFVVVRSE